MSEKQAKNDSNGINVKEFSKVSFDASGLIEEVLQVVKQYQKIRHEQELRESREILGLGLRSMFSNTIDDEQVLNALLSRAEMVHPDYNKHPDASAVFAKILNAAVVLGISEANIQAIKYLNKVDIKNALLVKGKWIMKADMQEGKNSQEKSSSSRQVAMNDVLKMLQEIQRHYNSKA